METNTSFYGVREITREIVDHVKIPVTLIVKETTTTFVRIIPNVSVIVIEMDLVTNEAVLTFVIARAILKESNTVSVTVIDRVIVTKTVNVMKKVKGLALKKDIATAKNEGKVTRLVIKGDTKKKTGRCGSV